MEQDRSPCIFLKWRIKNFSCWMKSAHGESIACWESAVPGSTTIRLLLYPRGESGDGDRIVMTYEGLKNVHEDDDLSFVGPDGSPFFCTLPVQEVSSGGTTANRVVGPIFEEVVSLIERNEDLHGDHLTLEFRCKEPREHQIHMITTLEVLENSLKITQPSPSRDGPVTIASVSYCKGLGSFEERVLVIYHTVEKILRLVPAPAQGFKYCLRVYDGSDVLVRQVKGEDTFTHHHIDLDSALESGGHCILRLKIVTGLCRSHFSDFLHSGSPLESAAKRIREISVSEGSNTLIKDLQSLYQDRKFSDFQLKCGDVTFPVHRSILCARSPVFKAMLSSDMREAVSGSVDIEDLDPTSLELFLEFLYTGTFKEVPDDRALKLYYAANKYKVPSLVKECANRLSSQK